MGNQNLREIIKEEYKKCALDPIYFILKYCKIRHAKRGIITFALYPFQGNLLKMFINESRVIIKKNRQMGISTLTAAYSLWLMIFHPFKFIYVVATKQDVAKNIIDKVRLMHSHLPSWLKIKCTEDNKLGQSYINGSKIVTSTSTKEAGRSEAVSLLIVDECAHIDKFDDVWTALQPVISTGGDIIVLSTPNGFGNWFAQTFINAEEGNNTFIPVNLHWSMHPERDQEWRDQQDIELGPRKARQECDGSFLASGETVVDSDLLQFYIDTYVEEPIQKEGIDKNVWIWEYPDYTKKYMLIADVSRGDGSDFNAFHVIDIELMTQVAEYKGKLDTKSYGNLCVEYATKYNDALLIIENQNVGWHVVQVALDREYKNLYYTETKEPYVDKKKITNKYRRIDKKKVPGFTTTRLNRPLMVSKMEQFFNDKSITVKSQRLLDELLVFVYVNGRPQASSGYNDDLVMSLSIGAWVRETALVLQKKRDELIKKTLELFKVDNVPPINVSSTPIGPNPYVIQVGNGEQEDLRNW